jgi:hypothetical protein
MKRKTKGVIGGGPKRTRCGVKDENHHLRAYELTAACNRFFRERGMPTGEDRKWTNGFGGARGD